MIFLFALLAIVLCDAKPGYSDSSLLGNDIGQETSSGVGGGGGSSYGYAGSFSGAGGFPSGNVPSFVPFIPQFDFSSFFEQLNRQHQEFIQHAGTDGGYGGGFSVGNKGGFVGGYGGGFTGPDGNGFSFSGPIGGAFASGSIGPGGAHQIASVFPENPNSPNINTQFGGSLLGDGGDFKSVFTSSKTVSTNVDGKPQTFRQASTTVNDNGKITTYTAHNP
ncbi:hypothetical protein ABEB36_011138 [Hypothenemus hampei]|uniref:Uncharacterized protein n=1 Tax=Hypothenemus hampei TaxID=57062 RepID=A0ABD1EEK4_HYPHA